MLEKIYWCENCNVPLLSNKCNLCGSKENKYCARDIKPVLKGELRLFKESLGFDIPSTLFRDKNRLIYNGRTLFRYTVPEDKTKKLGSIESKQQIKKNISSSDKKISWKKIQKANSNTLKILIKEAMSFINDVAENYPDNKKFISFSGGKDSTVTALLVKKTIGNIPLFFSDTTLEFPETYKYIETFSKKYKFRIFSDKSDQDFLKLCETLGPPSQLYRWCCTVFKAYPVNKFYDTFSDKNPVVTFDGIRANESPRRRNYSKISRVKKIPRQIASYPILYWREADVWFYLMFNNIYYNPLYTKGHTRVGCWACPGAGPYSCFIRKRTHPKIWAEYQNVLYQYAEKVNHDRKWVDNDYWRLRRPKKDNVSVVTVDQACEDKQKFSYLLKFKYNFENSIDNNFLEFLKPLGEIKRHSPKFSITIEDSYALKSEIFGRIGDKVIQTSFNPEKISEVKKKFEKQVMKAINCVGCGGCVGICPKGAISIKNNVLRIDDEKCNNCGNCIVSTFVTNGCISVNFAIKRKVISYDEKNNRGTNR